jgi:hypothetical protein
MSVVRKCDRCLLEVDVQSVLGCDICASCALDFPEWVADGTGGNLGPTGKHLKFGEPERIARKVGHGGRLFSTSSYARISGLSGRTPYYSLMGLHKRGIVRKHAANIWSLTQAAAEVAA